MTHWQLVVLLTSRRRRCTRPLGCTSTTGAINAHSQIGLISGLCQAALIRCSISTTSMRTVHVSCCSTVIRPDGSDTSSGPCAAGSNYATLPTAPCTWSAGRLPLPACCQSHPVKVHINTSTAHFGRASMPACASRILLNKCPAGTYPARPETSLSRLACPQMHTRTHCTGSTSC
jgi:hypothetical protein